MMFHIGVMVILTVTSLGLMPQPTQSETQEAFACAAQAAVLSCPSSSWYINITSADYAQHQNCTFYCCDCCTSQPGDCLSPVATEDPDEWTQIQTSCNNQTTCSVELEHNLFPQSSCVSPYNIHYMIVRYDCLTDETTPAPTTTPALTPSTAPTSMAPTTTRRTTTPDSGSNEDDDDDDADVGAIVGGVFAAVLLIVLIVLLVYLIYRLRRKPPPRKRVAKRPSNAAGAVTRPAAARSPGTSSAAPGTRPSTTGGAYDAPKPPYAAYDNNAYEQDVQLVVSENSNNKAPSTNGSAKANARLSNGSLAGMADLSGNAPAVANTAATKNKHDNIVNERRAITAEYHKVKKRPASNMSSPPPVATAAPQQAGVKQAQKPVKPPKPPAPPSGAGHTRPNSTHYDTPPSNTAVKTASLPVQRENAYEDVMTEQAPPLEQKTAPTDAVEAK